MMCIVNSAIQIELNWMKTHTSWPYPRMTMSKFIRLKLWKNGWEGAWRVIFTHELAHLSKDLKFIESLGCAGGDFTECWTLALSIQHLDQKCM